MHQGFDPSSGAELPAALGHPRPAQPQDDLADRPPWKGADGGLVPDVAHLVQSGVSICVGAREPGLRPVAGLGLACWVAGEGRLRLIVRRRGNERLLAAIADGSPLAVTFSLPTTHRSIQLKAPRAEIDAPGPEDEAHRARQHRAVRDELLAVGYPNGFSEGFSAAEGEGLAVIVFVPADAFVQTPGPGAGSPLP